MTDPYVAPVPALGLEITNRCNLSCRHCFNRSGEGAVQELSLSDMLSVFQQAQGMGIQHVRLSGGEPTLHPDFAPIVNGAVQHGMCVSINTNGLYAQGTRRRLAGLPIDLFIISLDGLQATNDALRGQGVFGQVVESVAWLRRQGRAVTLGVHLAQSTIADIPGLIALASDLDANIKFAPLRPAGRARDNLAHDLVTAAGMYQAVHDITRLRSAYPQITIKTDFDILQATDSAAPVSPERLCCPAGRGMLNINNDGYVYPCAFLATANRQFTAGHIHQSSLTSMWRSAPIFQTLRTLQKDARCSQCFAYGRTCVGGCLALGLRRHRPA